MNKYINKLLILLVLGILLGLITLGSGLISKLIIRAGHCEKTKTVLFLSGMITVFVLFLLGYLYHKYEGPDHRDKYIGKLIAKYNEAIAELKAEQFRYYLQPGLGSPTDKPSEEYRYAKIGDDPSEYYRYTDGTGLRATEEYRYGTGLDATGKEEYRYTACPAGYQGPGCTKE